MRKAKLPYVKPVTAKGRRYEYFDTGATKANGRPIYKRLPSRDDPGFGNAYASLIAGRTRRANVAAELSIGRLIAIYEKSPEFRKLAAGTRKVYDVYLRLIADQLDPAPAVGVERSDVLLLRDTMADRPGAANGMVRTMRALYRWARDRQHLDVDPCKGITLFESKDYEPWPEPLLTAALAADPAISLPVALLYYSAQRVGDVCALRWSDIRDGTIYVTQEKTGKELEIKVHSDLAARLAATPRTGMTILTGRHGRPTNRDRILEKLQAFAAARGHKVVTHGLRKNAVNALLEAGCSVAETSAVSGQSLQMVEHYAKRRSTRRLASAAILKMEGGKS